ncbi:MAG: hypothetical protein COT74_00610 [Bdellovibrionales bacterium CG10_big_fil_rev_8_21_14_0_10_45_34]|nr:MAG: hypothetical protein COT74_00610 [Bdellovibrionales bacterium CG10_big_fil_rev_8_21_14_0_10_45_34]
MKRLLAVLTLVLGVGAHADGFKIGLGGYCPVGFVKAGKSVFGDPKFASEYEGTTFYNSSADAKKMFDKDPASFVGAIKYKGFCATGLAMSKKLESDPSIFSRIDGSIYFFSSKEAKTMFDKDPKKFIGQANAEWAKLQ